MEMVTSLDRTNLGDSGTVQQKTEIYLIYVQKVDLVLFTKCFVVMVKFYSKYSLYVSTTITISSRDQLIQYTSRLKN